MIFGFQDEISGGSVERTEERDGLSLTGEYSYSDGFFKRTGKLKRICTSYYQIYLRGENE